MLVVSVLVAVSTAACGGGSGGDAAPAGDTVTMRLIAYKPDSLTVEVGETVTWEQTDAGAHTVTSGTVEQGAAGVTQRPDEKFDSGNLSTDESFERTFEEPGTYPYYCSLHPATMRGEIRVT